MIKEKLTDRPRRLACMRPFLALLTASLLCGGLIACADDGEPTMLDSDSTSPGDGDKAVQPGTPRLFLLIVVDQMRGDYLDRFAPLFDSGFARLRAEGQIFSNAHQDHAVTSTSPGHATISTGMHPASHGIINNNWFDRAIGEEIYSVEDKEHGRSPLRLATPTFSDRLKEFWPQSKVITMGGKDRSAVLTAGRKADGAYWYNTSTGAFTTSTYYRPQLQEERARGESGLPAWLDDFHSQRWLDQFFATTWTPTFSLEQLAEKGVTGIEPLRRGDFTQGFPYSFGGPTMTPGASFYRSIYSTPFIDSYVGGLAQAAIAGESLGQDEIPDMLAVNFSAPDAVGHGLGPDSPELVDTMVRLDQTIGLLLDAVDRAVGLENVVIALSSDHGVGQVPEVASARGRDAGRLGTETALCFQQLGKDLTQRFGLEGASWMPSLFYFDRPVLEERGVNFEAIRKAVAEGAERCPRVARVFLPEDLDTAANDPLTTLYQRNYREGSSPDLLLHLEANTLATTTTASHGTAHRYDTWVPMLFRVPGFPPQRIKGEVSVTDIAPTVAAVLGLPGAEYDGLNRLPQFEGGNARWQE